MVNNPVEIESVPVGEMAESAPVKASQTAPESAPVEASQTAPESAPESVPAPQEAEVTQEEPKPKRKPGRPVGAKSKIQGKPRAKRKVVVHTPTPEQSEEELPTKAELPRVLQGSLPIPAMSHDQKSALMLQLLQQQAQTRRERKAAVWRSWFQ